MLAAHRELWGTDKGLVSREGSGGDDGNYEEASEQVTSEMSPQERR